MTPWEVEETTREAHEVGLLRPSGVEPLMVDFLRGGDWTEARGFGVEPSPQHSKLFGYMAVRGVNLPPEQEPLSRSFYLLSQDVGSDIEWGKQ